MFRLQCLYLMFLLPGTAPDSHMAYSFTSSLCSLIIISKIVTLYLSLPFRYTTSSTLIFLHSTYHLVKYYLFYLFSLLPSFTGSLFSLLFVPNIMNIVWYIASDKYIICFLVLMRGWGKQALSNIIGKIINQQSF